MAKYNKNNAKITLFLHLTVIPRKLLAQNMAYPGMLYSLL